jgi:hypothetical protein
MCEQVSFEPPSALRSHFLGRFLFGLLPLLPLLAPSFIHSGALSRLRFPSRYRQHTQQVRERVQKTVDAKRANRALETGRKEP